MIFEATFSSKIRASRSYTLKRSENISLLFGLFSDRVSSNVRIRS